jgi:hypothetical protein
MKTTDIKIFLNKMFNEMYEKTERDSRYLRNYIYNQYEAGNISLSESDLYDILDAADNY